MDTWMLLGGPVGAGKSHLLHIMDTMLSPWSLYISVPDFKDMVFASTGNGGLTDLLDKVSVHPILLLDDVGAEWASGYAVTALRQVIMSRYTNWRDLPTIVVTNLTGGQFKTYDERMADRLFDTEKVMNVAFENVKSWRRYGNQ
jgi:DNA replication protein DnaC